MGKRIVIVLVLLAAGGVVGFFALTVAVQNEPNLAVAIVALFSPGLKVAEMLVPVKREALGSTFGGFLRVAIAVNSVFYFGIFAFVAVLVGRFMRRQNR
jgi:hypothetical protein